MLTFKKALVVAMTIALAQCGGGSDSPVPTTPTPPAQPSPPAAPVQLAMFTEQASGFSTSDVRDSQDQIVRFDLANGSLIWAGDGRSFSGFPVDGFFVRADKFFQVRFGAKDGERRAYFTEAVAGTICDVEVVAGQLVILPTSVTVPGS